MFRPGTILKQKLHSFNIAVFDCVHQRRSIIPPVLLIWISPMLQPRLKPLQVVLFNKQRQRRIRTILCIDGNVHWKHDNIRHNLQRQVCKTRKCRWRIKSTQIQIPFRSTEKTLRRLWTSLMPRFNIETKASRATHQNKQKNKLNSPKGQRMKHSSMSVSVVHRTFAI